MRFAFILLVSALIALPCLTQVPPLIYQQQNNAGEEMVTMQNTNNQMLDLQYVMGLINAPGMTTANYTKALQAWLQILQAYPGLLNNNLTYAFDW